MDSNLLVNEQLDEGRRIVDGFLLDGHDLTASFWLKASEDGRWYFYIATKIVEDSGLASGYKAVLRVVRRLNPPAIIDPLEGVKVIGATNPVTRDVLEIVSRYGESAGIRYRGNHLGGIRIDDAYIYPPRVAAEASGR